MQGSLQKQPRIKILPAFIANERLRLREADIDEAVKTVQGVLPQQVDGDIDVTITLLEKNLKIMADMSPYEGSFDSSCQEMQCPVAASSH